MADNEAIIPVADVHAAKFTITYAGSQGDLVDPVPYDATDDILKQMATEALRGGIPGIDPVEADLTDFVIDRFNARPDVPWNRVVARPKTPFGKQALAGRSVDRTW